MNYQKKGSFKAFVKTQLNIIRMVYKESPKTIILNCLLILASAIFAPVLILINKEVIDLISLLNSDNSYFKPIIYMLLVYFILQYTSILLKNLDEYIFVIITNKFNYVIRKDVIIKLVEIPLELFNDNKFYDMMNLANQAISRNALGVLNSLMNIISLLVSLVGIYGILLSIHWSLPLALFISTVPGIVLVFLAKTKGYKVSRKTSPTNREMQFTEGLFSDIRSNKEIKLNQLKDYLLLKWSTLFSKVLNENIKLAFWEFKTKSLAVFMLQVTHFGVSIILVNQISNDNLSIGSYVAVLGAATAVQGMFASIGGHLGTIFETTIYNNALVLLLNYKVENKNYNQESLQNVKRIENITLENVCFTYPNSNVTVLDNINLSINIGEKISIVGSNGSGKTTLINCILGLYKPTSGKITINGVVLEEVNITEYYKIVSSVFQDFTRYKYSLRENIGFGDVLKVGNDEKLFEILKKVELLEKVTQYKNQLETYLTNEMIDGTELSGGEWQRIAIARSFFKEASLIILDEPTSALDPITEMNIFELFKNLSENRTSLTISHRLGPTKFSDRIIVMDKGSIVEQGEFNHLMNKKGIFFEMYQSQSSWYENKEAVTNGGR